MPNPPFDPLEARLLMVVEMLNRAADEVQRLVEEIKNDQKEAPGDVRTTR